MSLGFDLLVAPMKHLAPKTAQPKNQSFCNTLNPMIAGKFRGIFLKKMGHSMPLFLYFRLFNTQLTVNKCSIYIKKIDDDWIRTADLWYWKQPL